MNGMKQYILLMLIILSCNSMCLATPAWELWTINPNTMHRLKLATIGGSGINEIVWSPDRSKIAFSSDVTGVWEIFVISADGSSLSQVTTDGADGYGAGNYAPCWEGNDYLLYTTARAGGGRRVLVRIKLDGTEEKILTDSAGTGISHMMPCLSADGTHIAYSKGIPYRANSSKLYVTDYPSFANERLVADINGNSGGEWYPDWFQNNQLTFLYNDFESGSTSKIYTVLADSSNLIDISLKADVHDYYPKYSPNGDKVVFGSDDGGANNIWIMNVDGTNRTQLTFATTSGVYGLFADWGDGLIAYAKYEEPYTCGDANGDGKINVGDAVFLINYIFKDGSAPAPIQAGDANCDTKVNVGDAVYLINYVFKSGPEPCCP